MTAAGRLYARQGFAATTVDAIAAEAGVSRKTVFTSVGGKVALLKLAYDYAVAGDDEPVPMIEREGLKTIIAEPDPYEQMRLFAALVTGMGERISGLWLALRGAAEVDPEARELYERWRRERLDGMRAGPVADLRAKAAIRDDLTDEEAAALYWVLVDPEALPPPGGRRRLVAGPVPGLAVRHLRKPDPQAGSLTVGRRWPAETRARPYPVKISNATQMRAKPAHRAVGMASPK